jgi:hypothetical protein
VDATQKPCLNRILGFHSGHLGERDVAIRDAMRPTDNEYKATKSECVGTHVREQLGSALKMPNSPEATGDEFQTRGWLKITCSCGQVPGRHYPTLPLPRHLGQTQERYCNFIYFFQTPTFSFTATATASANQGAFSNIGELRLFNFVGPCRLVKLPRIHRRWTVQKRVVALRLDLG